MKKWEKFTREEIEQFVKESRSYRQLATKIGYSEKTDNFLSPIKEMIKELDLDISHFTGQASNKNNFDYSRFRYGNVIKSANAIDAIAYLRGRRCEYCGLDTWMEKPIPLEVHHIDGDDLNSDLNNLQLLCPNCHALTENFKGKNINNKERLKVTDEDLLLSLQNSTSIRQALMSVGLTGKGANYERAYRLIHEYQIEKFLPGAPSKETA